MGHASVVFPGQASQAELPAIRKIADEFQPGVFEPIRFIGD
ncbi:MAG: hypothetical protein NVS4B9_36930 [Ktedonobacteraceae bacterium]